MENKIIKVGFLQENEGENSMARLIALILVCLAVFLIFSAGIVNICAAFTTSVVPMEYPIILSMQLIGWGIAAKHGGRFLEDWGKK